MARNWQAGSAVLGVVIAATLIASAPTGVAQQATTTTVPPTSSGSAPPVDATSAPSAAPSGAAFDTTIPANPIVIGGPGVSVPTDGTVNFVFLGTAGQTVFVRANRPWSMQDPYGARPPLSGTTVRLVHSGRYLLNLEKGLLAPATVAVTAVSPTPVVLRAGVGQLIVFDSAQTREQYARVPVRGGIRYMIATRPGQSASFCAADWTKFIEALGCVSSPSVGDADSAATFIPTVDQEVVVSASYVPGETVPNPTVRIEELPSDILVDPTVTPITELNPAPNQRVVIPFWGTPAQRAVLSSPVAGNVVPWGQPWIDKEAGSAGSVKVYATPVSFSPKQPPFVAWSNGLSAQRFGVYRGEDTAVVVPATGQPVAVRNSAWFAAVGSLPVEPGGRYVLQITGSSIRPVSLGLRDPAGKLTSNFAPWQWTEDGAQQRAVTSFTADRGGNWAIEMRPSGNAVKDVAVSLLKVGGGGSFEGAVVVDDVLTVGDETDVQLSPNEFARFTLKLDDATPQIIQPEVLKFRNKTFQPSAVDMSLWDSRGRLVWSNNRTVDEEVLSGRLGTEKDLTERFATVAAADAYTLIIDPLVNVSGRFRVSVKSSPVISDVPLGGGAIPVLPGGTQTGVVEVRTPTRYRVQGTTACMEASSTVEMGGQRRCLQSGESITLPVGVHRVSFSPKVVVSATFGAVAADSPDLRPTVNATLGGRISIPLGGSVGVVRFALSAGNRVQLDELNGVVVEPDGTVRDVGHVYVATAPGTYELRVAQTLGTIARSGVIRRAPAEVSTTALKVGAAKSSVFALVNGTRLEARVVVANPGKGKVSGVALDLFAAEGGSVRFLYAADERERRYGGPGGSDGSDGSDGFVEMPPGTYRFVFVGDGAVRLRLARLVG